MSASIKVCLLAAVGLLLLGACSKPAPPASADKPQAPVAARSVKMTPALALGETTQGFQLAAEIRPSIEARVGFRVAGRVTKRLVSLGSQVKVGTLIAQIDPQDYQLSASAAKSAQLAAETEARQTQSDYQRYVELHRKGFISDAALEQRKNAASASTARVDQAKAQTSSQNNQTAYTSLTAPSAGVVVGVEAEVGQVLAAGQTVVRIAKDDDKQAWINVPEALLGQFALNKPIDLTSSALPGKLIKGAVVEISPLADPATRTFLVKIRLEPNAGLQLGMSAQAKVLLQGNPMEQSLTKVPLTALVHSAGKTQVWVVVQGKVQARDVKVIAASGQSEAQVQGLAPGEQVVAAGSNLLANGDSVVAWGANQ
jgi:membrane fusion protein, multidrug efflux system